MDPRPRAPCQGTGTRTRHALPAVRLAGLSPLEAHLLIELENGPATNQQLAERLRIDKSSASRPWPASPSGKAYRLATPTPLTGAARRASLTRRARHSLRSCTGRWTRPWRGPLASSPRRVRRQIWEGMRLYRSALAHPPPAGLRHPPHHGRQSPGSRRRGARAPSPPNTASPPTRGTGVADPNLDFLPRPIRERGHYWVIEGPDGAILGSGWAPLAGAADVCELQDVLPARLRGLGLRTAAGVAGAGRGSRPGLPALLSGDHRRAAPCRPLANPWASNTCLGPLAAGHDACEIRMVLALDGKEGDERDQPDSLSAYETSASGERVKLGLSLSISTAVPWLTMSLSALRGDTVERLHRARNTHPVPSFYL